jgi:hypothetical protein
MQVTTYQRTESAEAAAERKPLQAKGSSLKRIADWIKERVEIVDVRSGIYARHLVTATLRELFRFEYPETKWANGEFVAISTTVDEGATEYSFQELGHVGRAKIVADNATDLPYAELEGRNNLRAIHTLGIKIQFSTQDVRTARLQGLFDVASEKSSAAREGHDFALNDLIRSGDLAAGLDGFINAPGIIVLNAATANWVAGTAEQIITDVSTAINTMIIGSNGVETPNTVVFDLVAWTNVTTRRASTTAPSDTTILAFLQQAHPYITNWTWDVGLSTASQAGGPAVMIFRKDANRQRAIAPMLLRALPPEQKGLVFEVNFESRFGGVIVPKPLSVLRLERTT